MLPAAQAIEGDLDIRKEAFCSLAKTAPLSSNGIFRLCHTFSLVLMGWSSVQQ